MLESIVLDARKLDDYTIADYQDAAAHAVNFYVAYIASQCSGASAHSLRSCLPGGGWLMVWQDPVMRNRTDGALIRLTTLLQPKVELKAADTRPRAIAVPRLTDYCSGLTRCDRITTQKIDELV